MTPCQEHVATRKKGDSDPWFPVAENGDEARGDRYYAWAIEQCKTRCPLIGACLLDGLDEDAGVWGGTTPRVRRKMRKQAAAA